MEQVNDAQSVAQWRTQHQKRAVNPKISAPCLRLATSDVNQRKTSYQKILEKRVISDTGRGCRPIPYTEQFRQRL